jgi:hypothetical protein
MDAPKTERRKKSHKAKENYERNGAFSQKHIRISEALSQKRAAQGNTTKSSKN